MATAEQLELEQFLTADELVQSDHPEIVETARKVIEGAESDREKAVRIFYWVRDSIAYCIEADRPALDVLREGRGVCVTKTLLHVALLRAAGIPARIGHADYKSDVLRQMFPDAYMDRQPEVYPLHTFAEAYLDGRWITCDATVDREFARDLGFQLNEFDGESSTPPMTGEENVVRRYSSASGPEMMQLYVAALEEIQLSHDELRRHYQLLDVYVETLRIRKRLEALERNITSKLLAS
jgi:transglutaminase-like putative cysteine protease